MRSSFIQELAIAITKISDPDIAGQFLHNILTPKEFEEIALRLQIFKMLKKGIPQRSIAKKLKVSIGTISRGSRELQYGPQGIHTVLSTLS
jgi:TrpR family trp operon transcriptional repressor